MRLPGRTARVDHCDSPAIARGNRQISLVYPRKERPLFFRNKMPELRLERFTMSAVWHERTHGDPAHRWLREVVAEEAAAI